MAQLPATEHDRDLHLVAFAQELGHLTVLGVEVADADLGPILHLFDAGTGCLAPRFLGPLRRVELELSEVHDSTHRRLRLRGDFDEIKIELPSDVERFGQRLDSQLLAIRVDQADFPGSYAVVDPVLVGGGGCGYRASLLKWSAPVLRPDIQKAGVGKQRPPLAVDRLIGLAGVSNNLVKSMEIRKALPPRFDPVSLFPRPSCGPARRRGFG